MPGFYITNCEPVIPQNREEKRCVLEMQQNDAFSVYRNTLNRYMKDKAFYQNERYIVILESVLLNKQELLNQYGKKELPELIDAMMEKDPCYFFQKFRGMFSGAVYFKNEKKWIIFTDQIGNKAVFYYFKDGRLIVGSQLNYITDTMKKNGIARIPNENGFNQFLNFGCFMDDSTWLQDVKRILPGDCVCIDQLGAEIRTYYQYPEKEIPMTEEEAISKLDLAFCHAVQRGIDKDLEYGYTSVVDISGGADSRMIAYTAKRLGLSNGILAHYSQSGSNEMKIAQKIAGDLEIPCYLNLLDDAEFMKDAEENILMNNGTGYYFGITGGKRMLQTLSGRNLGIEFTGLLGDISEGAMLGENGMLPPDLNYPRFRLTDTVSLHKLHVNTLQRFETNNMFWLYTRGMLCGMSTFFTRQNYAEPYTPYGDLEFLETVLTVPYEMRTNGKIQLKWMREKYPAAIKLQYASSGLPLLMDLMPFGPQITRIYVKLNSIKSKITGHSGLWMNPIEQWEREKPWLTEWKKEYSDNVISELKKIPQIDENLIVQIEALKEKDWQASYQAITIGTCLLKYIG